MAFEQVRVWSLAEKPQAGVKTPWQCHEVSSVIEAEMLAGKLLREGAYAAIPTWCEATDVGYGTNRVWRTLWGVRIVCSTVAYPGVR